MTPSSDILAVAMIFLILPPLGRVAPIQAAFVGGQTVALLYFGYSNGRTSTDARQANAALRPHASASFRSAAFSTQKPTTCSLVSVYGPVVTSSLPLGWIRSDLAFPAEERPATKTLAPAVTISSLSMSIS